MAITRRAALKLGIGAGALPLLTRSPLLAVPSATGATRLDGTVRARPLPLKAVRLQGGPLKNAQDLDASYLLQLDPDRMMAYYRDRARLPRKGEPYGGWDGDGRNLTGHIAGHYLSAVSLMYAATGDERFRGRADYLVEEMKTVQDRHGDGYLCALEGGRECFAELARGAIRSASFDLNGEWAPWYTLHKVYAGLRDAYRHAGNGTALEVETRMAEWAEGVLSGLDEAQLEHMMNTEFGGMNEVMVDLYQDTGDERWLALSYRFEHDDFTRPLKRHQDNLPGKHGNTQVPKLIGSADRYVVTGAPADLVAASFFWDTVVDHHSFASGGHGKDEYFGPADAWGQRVDGRTAETCNVYNMLKLTRRLFSIRPDAHYADFHERALFNHIMSSIDPEDGRTCYMVPVGRGVQHEYQNMFRSFTCCVGTGMESHALHGHGLYYEDGDRLFVNVYAPSTAEWSEAGVRVAMETDFPVGETATLRIAAAAPREFTLALRRPYWAGDGFAVRVNGRAIELPDAEPEEWRDRRSQYRIPADAGSSYVDIRRTWRSGDVIEVMLPKSLRIEATPDIPRRVALMWGPIVLAGDLGPERERSRGEEQERESRAPLVPVFVAAGKPVEEWVRPAGRPGHFRTIGAGRIPDETGRAQEVDLYPFFQLHRRTYSTYWDTYTDGEWAAQKALYVAEAERMRKLDAATVAYIEPGDEVLEARFNLQEEGARGYRIEGRPARWAEGWFSYDVPIEPATPMTLLVTFYSDDRRYSPADFQILINNQVVAEHHIDRTDPPRFYDARFPIPEHLTQGKNSVNIRFKAGPDSRVPAIFGVRVVRTAGLEEVDDLP